jgi:fructose-1,6-bisphosphatase/sedoheptulose 1,7-bisphosphatase-like protein
MDSDLSRILRVVEQAAVACAHTMGQGDRHNSDHVAVEAMRQVMDTVPIDGTIDGEGERDEAPMRNRRGRAAARQGGNGSSPTIRRRGHRRRSARRHEPVRDRATNAIAVLAASEKGGLLHAPDIYWKSWLWVPRRRCRQS